MAASGPWLVVHPGTGTILSLSDEVYIVDSQSIEPLPDPDDEMGIIEAAVHFGYPLDNRAAHNMHYSEPYDDTHEIRLIEHSCNGIDPRPVADCDACFIEKQIQDQIANHTEI